jgi:hypothetical protein
MICHDFQLKRASIIFAHTQTNDSADPSASGLPREMLAFGRSAASAADSG